MSFLAPLYALGMLAISLPVLFHLIRRRPKVQSEFSSLMFLTQTPPKLTKRSRVDQWPLLLLRALAILLLALAFARPFLRSLANLTAEPPGRRIILLVDISASMKRGDLWEKAKQRIRDVMEDVRPRDQVALTTFDSQNRSVIPFDRDLEVSAVSQRKLIMDAVEGLTLTNGGSNLGDALVAAADTLHNEAEIVQGGTERAEYAAPRQIVMVSDFQEGCDLSRLQQFQWPEGITVSVLQVKPDDTDNLSAVVLPQIVEDDETGVPQLRVRFRNSSDSQSDEFMYFWNSSGEGSSEEDNVIQVPAGESRVVRVDVPEHEASSLMFVGDKHAFDNEVHVALPTKRQQTVYFFGSEVRDKKDSLFYYLRQTEFGDAWREIKVEKIESERLLFSGEKGQGEQDRIDPLDVPLIVLGRATVPAEVMPQLKRYLEMGGRILYVLSQVESGYAKDEATIRQLSGARRFEISETSVDDYAMFGRIDFAHPVFATFADPKFNDFTKIRFWSHRNLETDPMDEWKVVASFDDDQPALIERDFGHGRLWVLAVGWQPKEGQLALSTKFVPLLASMIDSKFGQSEVKSNYEIGAKVQLPVAAPLELALPDGTTSSYQEPVFLNEFSEPGVYHAIKGNRRTPFAMNIPASESRTEALASDHLEQFGVTIKEIESRADLESRERQMQDVELESQQRLWQWLIFSVIGILLVETWFGGLVSRRLATGEES